MEMLGKVLLAVVLLFVLSKLVLNPENFEGHMDNGHMDNGHMDNGHGGEVMLAQQVEMPEALQEQPTERVIQPHEVASEMGQGPSVMAPSTQGAIMGTIGDEFGAAASVPKCEDQLCPGCLFCQTPKSGSCGYVTDDSKGNRKHMDIVNRIRQDRGEDWNMNFKII